MDINRVSILWCFLRITIKRFGGQTKIVYLWGMVSHYQSIAIKSFIGTFIGRYA